MFTMAKHIVSVCIFCFLCATHSPCASHAQVTHGGAQFRDNRIPFKDASENPLQQREPILREDEEPPSGGTTSNRFKKDIDSISPSVKNNSDKENEYLERLFRLYGDGNSIDLEAFQRLMRRLDLVGEMNAKFDGHDAEERSRHDGSKNLSECVDRDLLYAKIRSEVKINETTGINRTVLKQVCPALLFGLMVEGCPQVDVSFDNGTLVPKGSQAYAWLYSLIAITVISVCGVFGLAVIPVMQKTFYQPLLQFLVALAVGTLAGDALLHLLPHAMSSHHEHGEDDDNHDRNMWKGFVAMLGLIFFFLMERIIMLAARWRKKKQLKDKLPSKLNIIKPEISTQLTNAGDKQCKHKYSSFPYCYDEIKTDPDGTHEDHIFQVGTAGDHCESHNNTTSTGLDELGSHSDIHAFKSGHHIEKNQNMTECPNDDSNINCSEINKMISSEINKMLDGDNKEDADSLEYTVILREHDNPHHGHSHTHGHVHAAPKTMTSVAWMVIMGDGLHNFTDGMAIGAAFASGTAGGFSTAVAVFCHELPHELGDFAMLLKAGMSMKQALFYNLLSSVLCLFGNIFGLWVGTTEEASGWIFAAAAGMFLYIALVDMIPELSSGHEAQGTFLQCVLHLGGLLLGFGIMALIALYEHDLKSIFHET